MWLYYVICVWMIVLLCFSLFYSERIEQAYGADTWYEFSYYKIIDTGLFVLTILFLWWLTAFRSINIGNDTVSYVRFFEIVSQTGPSLDYRMEIGYQTLCYLISFLTDEPHYFLVIFSTILYFFAGVFIYRYSNFRSLSVVLLFCMCFSIFTTMLRQDLSMLLLGYAYMFFLQGRNKTTFVLIVLAGLMHKVGYTGFLFFLFKSLDIFKKKYLLLGFIGAVLSYSGFISYDFYTGTLGIETFSNYFQSKQAGAGHLAISLSLVECLVKYICVYICSYYTYFEERRRFFLSSINFDFAITSLGFATNIFDRAAGVIGFPFVSEFPMVCLSRSGKNGKIIISVLVLIMLVEFLVIREYRPEWNHLYPYEFW